MTKETEPDLNDKVSEASGYLIAGEILREGEVSHMDLPKRLRSGDREVALVEAGILLEEARQDVRDVRNKPVAQERDYDTDVLVSSAFGIERGQPTFSRDLKTAEKNLQNSILRINGIQNLDPNLSVGEDVIALVERVVRGFGKAAAAHKATGQKKLNEVTIK
ncbi:MAG TPA: hypothetical protein VG965_03420 [Patescibacteria group bacterium]|nr:hypothetical protein [Patescibacteria group bacterium]